MDFKVEESVTFDVVIFAAAAVVVIVIVVFVVASINMFRFLLILHFHMWISSTTHEFFFVRLCWWESHPSSFGFLLCGQVYMGGHNLLWGGEVGGGGDWKDLFGRVV